MAEDVQLELGASRGFEPLCSPFPCCLLCQCPCTGNALLQGVLELGGPDIGPASSLAQMDEQGASLRLKAWLLSLEEELTRSRVEFSSTGPFPPPPSPTSYTPSSAPRNEIAKEEKQLRAEDVLLKSFFFFLIGVWLIYNVVLISAVQQSYTYVCKNLFHFLFFPLWFITGH